MFRHTNNSRVSLLVKYQMVPLWASRTFSSPAWFTHVPQPIVRYKIYKSRFLSWSQFPPSTWTQHSLYYYRSPQLLWHTAILAPEDTTLRVCTHIPALPHAFTNLHSFLVKTPLALPTPVALLHRVVLSLLHSFGQPIRVWRTRARNFHKEAGLSMDFGPITVTGTYKLRVHFFRIPQRISRSFEQYCDPSRQYDPDPSPASFPNGTAIPAYKGPGVDTFIEEFERQQLLNYSSFFYSLWFHHHIITLSEQVLD